MQRHDQLTEIWQEDKIMEFLLEKAKTATSPVGLTPLIEEFVRLYGHYHEPSAVCKRFRDKISRRLHTLPAISDPEKAKLLFVTSIPANKLMLAELEKHALVKIDDNRRIIKYTTFNEQVKFEGTHQKTGPVSANDSSASSGASTDPKKRKGKNDKEQQEQKEPPNKKTREGDEEVKEIVEMENVPGEEKVNEGNDNGPKEGIAVEKVVASGDKAEPKKHKKNSAGKDQEEKEAPKDAPKKDTMKEETPKKNVDPEEKLVVEVPKGNTTAEEADIEVVAAQQDHEEITEVGVQDEEEARAPTPHGLSSRRENQNVGALKENPQEDHVETLKGLKEVKKEVEEKDEKYVEKVMEIEMKKVKEEVIEDATAPENVKPSGQNSESTDDNQHAAESTSSDVVRRRSSRKAATIKYRRNASPDPVVEKKAPEAHRKSKTQNSRGKPQAQTVAEIQKAPVIAKVSEPHSVTSVEPPKLRGKEQEQPKSVVKAKDFAKVAPKDIPKGLESRPHGTAPKASNSKKPVTPLKTRGESLVDIKSKDVPKDQEKKVQETKPTGINETPQIRRSTRVSEAREKAAKMIASAPSTPAAPANLMMMKARPKPRVRHPTISNEAPAPQQQKNMGDMMNAMQNFTKKQTKTIQKINAQLLQDPQIPLSKETAGTSAGIQARGPPGVPPPRESGSPVTAKHYLEHIRRFLDTVASPQFVQITKRIDAILEKLEDRNEPIHMDTLQSALEATITLVCPPDLQ